MPVAKVIDETPVPVKVWTDDVDPAAVAQLRNVSKLPFVFGHVAAMPDVHTGIGATVGSVVATREAVIPAAVGVDIGCFRGDTKVPLLDGTQATLERLAGRIEPFWVYSLDDSLRVGPGRARCLRTRTDAELMRVVVCGGDQIICTPDHEFMLGGGTYRQAKDLRLDDSLMALRRTRFEGHSPGRGTTMKTQRLDERADVYCLQVEEHHNFALAAGVFVHNCGMIAARLSATANDLDQARLRRIFGQISRDVPVGAAQHSEPRARIDAALPFKVGLDALVERHPRLLKTFGRHSNWMQQMGTLGGGNHFIEVCLDEANRVWVMLHSGSRGIGNAIGTYFIDLARREVDTSGVHLPDRDLAYLREGSAHFDDYVRAVSWAQAYAARNRDEMLALVLGALARHLPPFDIASAIVNCHHNYVAREHHFGADVWVTRKGAIRAGEGELGIVPGSMGTRSYIVRGKGNPESFASSAHGAGRRMSRAAANRRFTVADLARQTEGVVCRKDSGVIDETPGAYKDIDRVMANQSDLTEIVHTLKQVVCVKG